jgi:putative addiction module killer protein
MRLEIVEYETAGARSPFGQWFAKLDPVAAAKVVVAISRMAQGNPGNVRSLGEGISECRIDTGPGYRVYFGRDGAILMVLLAGGTKARQQRDIDTARKYWKDYKQRRTALR